MHHVVEPVLDLGYVVGVIEIRFSQWDVVDKVLKNWLLFINRLGLATVVVHVTFVLGVPTDGSDDNNIDSNKSFQVLLLRINNGSSSRWGH